MMSSENALTLDGLREIFRPLLLQKQWIDFCDKIEKGAVIVVGADAENFARERFPAAEVHVSAWVEPRTMYALDKAPFGFRAVLTETD